MNRKYHKNYYFHFSLQWFSKMSCDPSYTLDHVETQFCVCASEHLIK